MRTDSTPPEAANAKRVLVAVALDAASGTALQRGDVFARALDAELHVLHVLPGRLRDRVGRPDAPVSDDSIEESHIAREAMLRFCETMLARPFSPRRILVRRGQIAEAILETAAWLDATLVVVGGDDGAAPGEHRHGRVVTKVVRQAARPVLVARGATRSDAIVAATDFTDATFPALAQAAEISGRLEAPLTFVHNIEPFGALVAGTTFGVPAMLLGVAVRDAEQQRAENLRHLAARLGQGINTVVTSQETATDAILTVARERDADMVVVGTHRRRGLRGLFGQGTAEMVATTAKRSVLAIPIAQ